MGLFKYIYFTLKNDLKENFFYVITMAMSIVMIFISFNIIFNEDIIIRASYEYRIMSLLGLVVLSVLILFMIFSNSYYLEDKYKEYGVISLSGRSTFEVFIIISLRNILISLISILFGCLLGYILNPFIMKRVYQMINIDGQYNFVSLESIALTIMITLTVVIITFLINSGGIYKKKIIELMIKKRENYTPIDRDGKKSAYVYLLFYIVPFVVVLLPLSSRDKVFVMLAAIIISIFGSQGMVRYVIPNCFANYKKRALITDKIRLIVVSNLYTSIRKSASLILMLIISTVISIVIISQYEVGTIINTFSVVCFLFVAFIMNFTITYKFFIEAKRRKDNYKQLNLLGYTYKEISKIILSEVVVYYFIFTTIVMLQMILIIVVSVSGGFITPSFGFKLVGEYLGITLIFSIVSYLGYKRIAGRKK